MQAAISQHRNTPYILCIGELYKYLFFKTIQIQNLGENICHIKQYLIVVEKTVVADVSC